MSLLRPLSPFEKLFADTDEIVQLAVEVSHPKHIHNVLDILLKGISAFHLRTDGTSIYHNPSPVEIFDMPRSVKTACEAANWLDREHRPDISKRLASVAVNDTKVAVAASHLLCDGGFCVRMVQRIISNVHDVAPLIPRSVEDVFAKELANPNLDVQGHVDDVWKLVRVSWSDDVEKNLPEDVRCRYIYKCLKVEELSCWDKERKRLNGLTENLWLSIALSYAAFSNTLERLGISTDFDLRQLLKGKPDLSMGNVFTAASIHPGKFTHDMTLGQIGALMRKDLVAKINNGGMFATIKGGLGGYTVSPPKSAFAELSNVGRMHLKEPLVDVWLQQTMKSRGVETIMPTLSFTTTGDCERKIAVRSQYSPTVVPDRMASVLHQSIMHSLKTMTMDTPLTTAFEEMRRFQKTIA